MTGRVDVGRRPARGAAVSAAGWLAAVVLVALNLRPAIASVPPLAEVLGADLALSATALGLLTTLPVLCMGLFAPLGALAARRFGPDRVLTGALLLIAVSVALRVLDRPTALLFVTAATAGMGIAVAGALLPPLVRARFPDRVGPVTGLYTTGLIGGALLAAGITPALASASGHWSTALGWWALPAIIAATAWPLASGRPTVPAAVRRSTPISAESGHDRFVPWRSGRVWAATVFMGGQSLLYYAALAWLAARYTDLGTTVSEAGLLLALFSATQLVSALGLPILAHRSGDPRPWIVLSLLLTGVALTLVAFTPLTAPWLWVSVLGVGVGGQFALALTVLSGLGRSSAESASATGMALFVGYLLAAAGPVAAGALRDATGGYTVPFAALAVLAVPVLACGVIGGAATRRQQPAGPAGPAR